MISTFIRTRFLEYKFQRICRSINEKPRDIDRWIDLISALKVGGHLSAQSRALVDAHDINKGGHAVHAFSAPIMDRAGPEFDRIAKSPCSEIDTAIQQIVKWKTALQCGYSHDVSKGYFIDAEPAMQLQWNQIIYPLIKDFDFSSVVDLACGHGRNSEMLSHHADEIHLIDINQSCIEACRDRFGTKKNKAKFFYYVTKGNNISMIQDASISLVYSWDSMVHFDKLIVNDYVSDIARALKEGGMAFLHHSNFGEVAPDSDWATNTGTRSDMSARLMQQYAQKAGLEVVDQKIQGRAEGWGVDGLDCASILRKPLRSATALR
ncbi:MAG TPA: class I SAM-dependent methyltransferase [Bosea sp. (in: a-proteobacteria)]|jgi:ubiquinone/menaquinone biosynthesis C-methylase UbiE|uniref:class I SAM-dependent methyltransferase n=1 Tax=Bosea sp. (in: a-proteobacteria) TaxID=1871050 RepID=UPI002E0F779A|nr:class I SAM-dependent methyltransferase [Bosea sp. (in: a-proteobacteria)]